MLKATTTLDDERRCARALLAWLDGDKLALDAALSEAMHAPAGVPGLLFAVLDFGATLAQELAELTDDYDPRTALRTFLLDLDGADTPPAGEVTPDE